MAHSQPFFRLASELAKEKGGHTCILTGRTPPFYAGAHRPPASSLLETLLTIFAAPEYQQVLVFSGIDGSQDIFFTAPEKDDTYLPYRIPVGWDIEKGGCGTERIGWIFRGEKQNNTQKSQPTTQDSFAVNIGTGKAQTISKGFKRLKNFSTLRTSWEANLEQMLSTVEDLCGFKWIDQKHIPSSNELSTDGFNLKNRTLVLLDEGFIRPGPNDRDFNPRLNQNRAVSDEQVRRIRKLGKRLSALPQCVQSSSIDLILFSDQVFLPDWLSSGRYFPECWYRQCLHAGLQIDNLKELYEEMRQYQNDFIWKEDMFQHFDCPTPDRPRQIYSPYLQLDLKQTEDKSRDYLAQDWPAQPSLKNALRSIPMVDVEMNALKELKDLIGMQNAKDKIRQIQNSIIKNLERKQQGIDFDPRFLYGHYVFQGKPGTGKTTVATMLGRIFKELGLLPKGHVVFAEAKDLIAGYVGQTALKTDKRINEAIGGILFIDEAYLLAGNKGLQGSGSFGSEAVDTLLTRMENEKGKFITVAAGYRERIPEFIQMNPGLSSRFLHYVEFDDYKPDELTKIFMESFGKIGKTNFLSDHSLENWLNDYFTEVYESRDERFSNARFVRNFYEQTLLYRDSRLADILETTKEQLQTFVVEDFINARTATENAQQQQK